MSSDRTKKSWWSRWDSNPRPPRCHRGALPTAPRPHRTSRVYHRTFPSDGIPPPSQAMQPPARFTSLILRVQTENGSAHKMNISAKPATVSRIHLRAARIMLSLACAAGAFAIPAVAQQQGPLPPPPAGSSSSGSPGMGSSGSAMPVEGGMAHSESAITSDPPAIPADQIIQKFSQHESEFKKERDNYTYTQTFVIQTVDPDGNPDGEYRLTTDISFTPEGKRYAKDTYAPPPSLTRITMSQQDLNDLENIQPFVLTTEDLPKYNVTYVGRQIVDDLQAYVFDVAPKEMKKKRALFPGTGMGRRKRPANREELRQSGSGHHEKE